MNVHTALTYITFEQERREAENAEIKKISKI